SSAFALESRLFNSHGFCLDIPDNRKPQDRPCSSTNATDRRANLAVHHRNPMMKGDSMLSRKLSRLGLAVIAAVGVSVAVTPSAHADDPQIARFVLADFGVNSGWDTAMHPRMLADVNG